MYHQGGISLLGRRVQAYRTRKGASTAGEELARGIVGTEKIVEHLRAPWLPFVGRLHSPRSERAVWALRCEPSHCLNRVPASLEPFCWKVVLWGELLRVESVGEGPWRRLGRIGEDSRSLGGGDPVVWHLRLKC
jgi:hypothetical protein